MPENVEIAAEAENDTIVLIGIEEKSYYLYAGEEHINQLLRADGDFPKPVKCLNFPSLFEVTIKLGQAVNISNFWGINPAIVQRLRDTGELVEIDGRN